MFVGLHATMALMTKTPELAITDQEGRDFTRAAQNVMRHYSVTTTQKTLDWVAFLGVTAGMYGTRAFAISSRRAQEREAARGERGKVLKFPDRGRPAETTATDQPDVNSTGYVPSVPPGDFGDQPGF